MCTCLQKHVGDRIAVSPLEWPMVRQKGYSVPLPRASQCRNIDLSWVETRMYSYPNVGSKDFIYQCDLNARYQLEGAVCPMHIR